MTDTTQPSADVERLRAALTGLLTHSHITDSDPADWELEDHAVESEARAALAAVQPREDDGWRLIASAPKDGTEILGWCVHGSDPYYFNDRSLTVYGAHVEGLSHVSDGAHVLVWGGGWSDCEDDGGGSLPDWWFRSDSEFDVAANPTHWRPLPAPPKVQS